MKFLFVLFGLIAAISAHPVSWTGGYGHDWSHDGHWAHGYHGDHYGHGWGHGWHGAPAHVALTHDAQYLQDTPAVSHAKHAHAVAHSSAAHRDWHGVNHDHAAHWGVHAYAHGHPHHYGHWW